MAKQRVKRLLGVPAIIRIKTQRGKCETVRGQISALFPAVFSITLEDGKTRTFPYADVHTGNIKFFNPDDPQP